MSDTFQMVVVTLVALAALVMLLRPLWTGRSEPTKPSGGCSTCASADHPASPASGSKRPPISPGHA